MCYAYTDVCTFYTLRFLKNELIGSVPQCSERICQNRKVNQVSMYDPWRNETATYTCHGTLFNPDNGGDIDAISWYSRTL